MASQVENVAWCASSIGPASKSDKAHMTNENSFGAMQTMSGRTEGHVTDIVREKPAPFVNKRALICDDAAEAPACALRNQHVCHPNCDAAGAKQGNAQKSGQVVSAILGFLTAVAQHQQTAAMLVEHSTLDFTSALADWLLSPEGAGNILCTPAPNLIGADYGIKPRQDSFLRASKLLDSLLQQ